MEIRLALHAELVPRPAAVAAADDPERIHEAGARRRMTAAVEVFRGRDKAHVIVLRSRRLGPLAVLVDGEAMMARDHQALSVGAIGKPVHVMERDGLRRRAGRRGGKQ
jgi:hypothetical protein